MCVIREQEGEPGERSGLEKGGKEALEEEKVEEGGVVRRGRDAVIWLEYLPSEEVDVQKMEGRGRGRRMKRLKAKKLTRNEEAQV